MRTLSLSAAVALLLTPLSALAQDAAPVRSLGDAYRAALAASETVGISEQSIRRAEALYRQALGSSLPLISARSSTLWQDNNQGRSATDVGLRLSQTGLSGYRELYAVRASKALSAQREAELLRAEQLLLGDVGGAFFGLLQSRENARTTEQLIGFADRRLTELKNRVRVGRSREADQIAQEVQLSQLESQLEESRRQTDARRDLLLYLTRAAAVEPAATDAPAAPRLPTLEAYLALVERRPDVAAAARAAEVADAGVHAARADLLPQANLLADWYASRSAPLTRTRWDGQLTFSFPLWSWGGLQGELAAAKATAGSQRLALQSVRRQAFVDVENAHRDYSSARRQLDIQRRAVDLAERDYDLQTRDERRGLVTSIEVLQSLDRLNTARLSFTSALLQARLAVLNLELAAGAKPEELDLR